MNPAHLSFLSFWRLPVARSWTRLLALVICATFVFPYLTWAFEPANFPAAASTVMHHNRPVEIPAKFGKVVEAYQGGSQLVVHIQDLHCNYEVQSHVAGILETLAREQGLRLVGLEGASRPVNVTKLSTVPQAAVRREVGEYFMKEGKLSGAEFFAATGSHPLDLAGVENPAHYQQAREKVSSFLNDESQGCVADLRDLLNEIKPTVYTPALAALDHQRMAFQAGEKPLAEYLKFLRAQAARQGVDFASWVLLEQYLAGASEGWETDALYAQMEALEQQVRETLYTDPVQRELDLRVRHLDMVEKLVNVSATPRELAEFRAHPALFGVHFYTEFIQRLKPDRDPAADADLFQLDRYLEGVRDFYALADARSRDFTGNLLKRLGSEASGAAVLITGGFHTEAVLQRLKEAGVSYVSIKPAIRHQDLVNPYFSLLRRHRTPLEKLLAQNQNIIALQPFFAEMDNARQIINGSEAGLPEEVKIGYGLLERIVKLDVIERLMLAGHAGLDDLKAAYAKDLADYRAQSPDVEPDFENALLRPDSALIRFGRDAFFCTLAPAGQAATMGEPLKSIVLQNLELSFYRNDQHHAVAARFKSGAAGMAGLAKARDRIAQALVPMGVALANGPAVAVASWLMPGASFPALAVRAPEPSAVPGKDKTAQGNPRTVGSRVYDWVAAQNFSRVWIWVLGGLTLVQAYLLGEKPAADPWAVPLLGLGLRLETDLLLRLISIQRVSSERAEVVPGQPGIWIEVKQGKWSRHLSLDLNLPEERVKKPWTRTQERLWVEKFVGGAERHEGVPDWQALSEAPAATRQTVALACLEQAPLATLAERSRFDVSWPNLPERTEDILHDFGNLLARLDYIALVAETGLPDIQDVQVSARELSAFWNGNIAAINRVFTGDVNATPQQRLEALRVALPDLKTVLEQSRLPAASAQGVLIGQTGEISSEAQAQQLYQSLLTLAFLGLAEVLGQLRSRYEAFLEKPDNLNVLERAGFKEAFYKLKDYLALIAEGTSLPEMLNWQEPERRFDLKQLHVLASAYPEFLRSSSLPYSIPVRVEAWPNSSPNLPIRVRGEPYRALIQMKNFITNAQRAMVRRAKAMPEEDRRAFLKSAAVLVRFDPAGFGYTVTDTGDGFSFEQAGKMFRRGYTEGMGMGLGLSSAANTARKFRGRLFFKTEVGRGTSVQVVFSQPVPPAARVSVGSGFKNRFRSAAELKQAKLNSARLNLVSEFLARPYSVHPALTAYVLAPLLENAWLVFPALAVMILGPPLLGPVLAFATAVVWVAGFAAYLSFMQHQWVFTSGTTLARPSSWAERAGIFGAFLFMGLGTLLFFALILHGLPSGELLFQWARTFDAFSRSALWAAPAAYLLGALAHSILNFPFWSRWFPRKPLLVGSRRDLLFAAQRFFKARGFTVTETNFTGGFSYVFKAVDAQGISHALKVDKTGEGIHNERMREFLARLGSIRHPRILLPTELATMPFAGTQLEYQLIPWVAGAEDWAQWARAHRWSAEDRRQVKASFADGFRQIAEAVLFLRRHGVWHGDLVTPDQQFTNILFNPEGFFVIDPMPLLDDEANRYLDISGLSTLFVQGSLPDLVGLSAETRREISDLLWREMIDQQPGNEKDYQTLLRSVEALAEKIRTELVPPLRTEPGRIWTVDEFLGRFKDGQLPPLVLGAAGFVGSHLTDALAGEGPVACLIRSRADIKNLSRAAQSDQVFLVETGDYLSPENLRRWEALVQGAPVIYHVAAQPNTRVENEAQAVQTYLTNVFFTALLAFYANRHNTPMLYGSSGHIYTLYPGRFSEPVTEETALPLSPEAREFIAAARSEFGQFAFDFSEHRALETPEAFTRNFLAKHGVLDLLAHPERNAPIEFKAGLYSMSKLIPEIFIQALHPGRGLVLRFTNAYGPRQRSGDVTSLLPSRLAQGKEVFASEDTRDFIQIEDSVRALTLAGQSLLAGKLKSNPVLLIASGRPVSMSELLGRIIALMEQRGWKLPEAFGLKPEKNLQQAPVIDTTEAGRVLGWAPRVPLEQGLADMLADWLPAPATPPAEPEIVKGSDISDPGKVRSLLALEAQSYQGMEMPRGFYEELSMTFQSEGRTPGRYFAVFEGGQAVGYVKSEPDDMTPGQIVGQDLYVAPGSFRRRGMATRLVFTALDFFKRQGAKLYRIEIGPKKEAQQFHLRLAESLGQAVTDRVALGQQFFSYNINLETLDQELIRTGLQGKLRSAGLPGIDGGMALSDLLAGALLEFEFQTAGPWGALDPGFRENFSRERLVPGRYFVAHEAGRILGFIKSKASSGDAREAECLDIQVAPGAARRQGIGTRLLYTALAYFKRQGEKTYTVSVSSSDEAQRFHRHAIQSLGPAAVNETYEAEDQLMGYSVNLESLTEAKLNEGLNQDLKSFPAAMPWLADMLGWFYNRLGRAVDEETLILETAPRVESTGLALAFTGVLTAAFFLVPGVGSLAFAGVASYLALNLTFGLLHNRMYVFNEELHTWQDVPASLRARLKLAWGAASKIHFPVLAGLAAMLPFQAGWLDASAHPVWWTVAWQLFSMIIAEISVRLHQYFNDGYFLPRWVGVVAQPALLNYLLRHREFLAPFLGFDRYFQAHPEKLTEFLEAAADQRFSLNRRQRADLEKNIQRVLGLGPGEGVKYTVLDSVMQPLIPAASDGKLRVLFNPGFVPGTFMLGERFHKPEFLAPEDRGNLRQWVAAQVASEMKNIQVLADRGAWDSRRFIQNVEAAETRTGLALGDIVFLSLFLTTPDGIALMDKIPNQIYQDVFNRIMSKFSWFHTYATPYVNQDFNAKMESLVGAFLPRLEKLSLREVFNFSVAAGALGLDLKSNASAASIINTTNVIPYARAGETDEQVRQERMFRELSQKAAKPFAIDFWPEFERQIVNATRKVTLVFFHDDYGETMLDLLFIQKLLEANPHVNVVSVPRATPAGYIRFGNDAAAADFFPHLGRTGFAPLFRYLLEGRYKFSTQGPCWGAVNGLEFSGEVADLVSRSTAIMVKGARSYEMLQGIRKDAYFAYMVCREFSESVTGVDAGTGLSVLIKQESGLPSFQGFRQRQNRSVALIGTGRKGWAATMTAHEYAQAVQSREYQNILEAFRQDKDRADAWILESSDRLHHTVAEFILKFSRDELAKTGERGLFATRATRPAKLKYDPLKGLPAPQFAYLDSLEPRVLHQGPEAPQYVEIQNTSRPNEVITLTRQPKQNQTNQGEDYAGEIPGEGPDRQIKVELFFYPGFLELVKIEVGQAGAGRGVATSLVQWLLQTALTLYPNSPYPLHIRAAENPATLALAEAVFQPGTLQIQDEKHDLAWKDLWAPGVDLYQITGPVKVPGLKETVWPERKGNAYVAAKVPAGYQARFFGARLELTDPTGQRVYGLSTDTEGYGYYNLKGTPRLWARPPTGVAVQSQEAFLATARPARPARAKSVLSEPQPAAAKLEKDLTASSWLLRLAARMAPKAGQDELLLRVMPRLESTFFNLAFLGTLTAGFFLLPGAGSLVFAGVASYITLNLGLGLLHSRLYLFNREIKAWQDVPATWSDRLKLAWTAMTQAHLPSLAALAALVPFKTGWLDAASHAAWWAATWSLLSVGVTEASVRLHQAYNRWAKAHGLPMLAIKPVGPIEKAPALGQQPRQAQQEKQGKPRQESKKEAPGETLVKSPELQMVERLLDPVERETALKDFSKLESRQQTAILTTLGYLIQQSEASGERQQQALEALRVLPKPGLALPEKYKPGGAMGKFEVTQIEVVTAQPITMSQLERDLLLGRPSSGIDAVKTLAEPQIRVTGHPINPAGQADLTREVEFLVTLRKLNGKEVQSLHGAVEALKQKQTAKQRWFGNDRQVLADVLNQAETLLSQAGGEIDLRRFAGYYAMNEVKVLRGPPDAVFNGLGLPGAVLLDRKLFADQEALGAALLHELGESLGYAHAFLRGLGAKAREALGGRLTPDQSGFVARVLGARAQNRLTQWLAQNRPQATRPGAVGAVVSAEEMRALLSPEPEGEAAPATLESVTEALRLYPKALYHTRELAGHLDAFDQEHYEFVETDPQNQTGYWRSKDFLPGGMNNVELMLGSWEDVEKQSPANHQKMKRHVVERFKRPEGGTVSFYYFDDHAFSVPYAMEAVERGEMPAQGNTQVFLDEHFDFSDLLSASGFPDERQFFSLARTLRAWYRGIKNFIYMNNLNWILGSTGFLKKHIWVFDSQSRLFLKEKVPNEIVAKDLDVNGHTVQYRAGGFDRYFQMKDRPKGERALINIDTDVVGDRLGVGDVHRPAAMGAAYALEVLAGFLERLAREDKVSPLSFHANTTVDMKTYGDVAIVRFLAQVAPALLLASSEADFSNLRKQVNAALVESAPGVQINSERTPDFVDLPATLPGETPGAAQADASDPEALADKILAQPLLAQMMERQAVSERMERERRILRNLILFAHQAPLADLMETARLDQMTSEERIAELDALLREYGNQFGGLSGPAEKLLKQSTVGGNDFHQAIFSISFLLENETSIAMVAKESPGLRELFVKNIQMAYLLLRSVETFSQTKPELLAERTDLRPFQALFPIVGSMRQWAEILSPVALGAPGRESAAVLRRLREGYAGFRAWQTLQVKIQANISKSTVPTPANVRSNYLHFLDLFRGALNHLDFYYQAMTLPEVRAAYERELAFLRLALVGLENLLEAHSAVLDLSEHLKAVLALAFFQQRDAVRQVMEELPALPGAIEASPAQIGTLFLNLFLPWRVKGTMPQIRLELRGRDWVMTLMGLPPDTPPNIVLSGARGSKLELDWMAEARKIAGALGGEVIRLAGPQNALQLRLPLGEPGSTLAGQPQTPVGAQGPSSLTSMMGRVIQGMKQGISRWLDFLPEIRWQSPVRVLQPLGPGLGIPVWQPPLVILSKGKERGGSREAAAQEKRLRDFAFQAKKFRQVLAPGQVFVDIAGVDPQKFQLNVEETDRLLKTGELGWREDEGVIKVWPKKSLPENWMDLIEEARYASADALMDRLLADQTWTLSLEGAGPESLKLSSEEAAVGVQDGRLAYDSDRGVLRPVGRTARDLLAGLALERRERAREFLETFQVDEPRTFGLEVSDEEYASIPLIRELGHPSTVEAAEGIRQGLFQFSVHADGSVWLRLVGEGMAAYYQQLHDARLARTEAFEAKLPENALYVDLESDTGLDRFEGADRPNVVEAHEGLMRGVLDWKEEGGQLRLYVVDMGTQEYMQEVRAARQQAAAEYAASLKPGQIYMEKSGSQEQKIPNTVWPTVEDVKQHLRDGRLVYQEHGGVKKVGMVGRAGGSFFEVISQDRKAAERRLLNVLPESGVVFVDLVDETGTVIPTTERPNLFDAVRHVREGRLTPVISPGHYGVRVVGVSAQAYAEELRRERQASADQFVRVFTESPLEDVRRGSIRGSAQESPDDIRSAIAPFGFANHRVESYQAIRAGRMVWSHEDKVLTRHVVGAKVVDFVEDMIDARQTLADDMLDFMRQHAQAGIEVGDQPEAAPAQAKKPASGKAKKEVKLSKTERERLKQLRQAETLTPFEAYRTVVMGLAVPKRLSHDRMQLVPADLSRKELVRSVKEGRQSPMSMAIAKFLNENATFAIGPVTLTQDEIIRSLAMNALALDTVSVPMRLKTAAGLSEAMFAQAVLSERQARKPSAQEKPETHAQAVSREPEKPGQAFDLAVNIAAFAGWTLLAAGYAAITALFPGAWFAHLWLAVFGSGVLVYGSRSLFGVLALNFARLVRARVDARHLAVNREWTERIAFQFSRSVDFSALNRIDRRFAETKPEQVFFAPWLVTDIQWQGEKRAALRLGLAFLQGINRLLRALLLPQVLAQEQMRVRGKGDAAIYFNPLLPLSYYLAQVFDPALVLLFKLRVRFSGVYRAFIRNQTQAAFPLMPGAQELLDAFRQSRLPVFMATASKTDQVRQALERYEISEAFTDIYGAGNEKAEAIRRIQQAPGEGIVVVIGDGRYDMQSARQVPGTFAIGLSEDPTQSDLPAHGAQAVVADFASFKWNPETRQLTFTNEQGENGEPVALENVKAVVFDYDGTLVDNQVYIRKMFGQLAAQWAGIEPADPRYAWAQRFGEEINAETTGMPKGLSFFVRYHRLRQFIQNPEQAVQERFGLSARARGMVPAQLGPGARFWIADKSLPPSLDPEQSLPASRVDLRHMPQGTLVHYFIGQGHWDYTLRVEGGGRVGLWLRQDRGCVNAPINRVGSLAPEGNDTQGVLDETQDAFMPYFQQTPFGKSPDRRLLHIDLIGFIEVPEKMTIQLPAGVDVSSLPAGALELILPGTLAQRRLKGAVGALGSYLQVIYRDRTFSAKPDFPAYASLVAFAERQARRDIADLGLNETFLGEAIAEAQSHFKQAMAGEDVEKQFFEDLITARLEALNKPSDKNQTPPTSGQTSTQGTAEAPESSEGLEPGTAVSDPANRLLQLFRGPRLLFMLALQAGLILLEVVLTGALGRSRTSFNQEAARRWQDGLARRYFRRDAAESIRFLPRGGVFQGGSWVERLLGRYQSRPGEVPRLELPEFLLGALSRTERRPSGAWQNTLALWRAKLAYQQIRQIYYYRSAAFYRQTWLARAVDKIGETWLAAGRFPLGPFSGFSHALLARVYGEVGYVNLVLASANQATPGMVQASRLAQSALAGDAQIRESLARLAGQGTEAQVREAWLALVGRISPETGEADWLYLSAVLSRFQRLRKTEVPVMLSQGASRRLAVPTTMFRSPRDAGLMLDRLRSQFGLDEDQLQPLLPQRPRFGFKESS